MDGATIVAIVAASIALFAMCITIWQAAEARKSRKATEAQAEIMRDQLDESRSERLERSRLDQRQSVLEVLRTGREWAAQADTVLSAMSMIHPLKAVEAENSKAYGSATKEFNATLTHCQFTVTDSEIIQLVNDLAAKPLEVIGLIPRLFESRRDQSGLAAPSDRTRASEIISSTHQLIDQLHQLTVTRLGNSKTSSSDITSTNSNT